MGAELVAHAPADGIERVGGETRQQNGIERMGHGRSFAARAARQHYPSKMFHGEHSSAAKCSPWNAFTGNIAASDVSRLRV